MSVTGTVKWFNSQKRFGFIAPEKSGISTLDNDQKVSFDIETKNGKRSAIDVAIV